MRGLVGKKIGMSRIFDDSGSVVPVTVLQMGPCAVVQIKTKNKDGYDAIQVGYDSVKNNKTSKPKIGHFNKHNLQNPYKKLLEFPVVPDFKYKSGQIFNVAIFQLGDLVNVSGITKGRGFAGVIKRHNFARQKKTHGTGHTERAPGSIGQASDPSRVFPGMRMAGHYGNTKMTVKNLRVVKVSKSDNIIMVRGAVPGHKNGIVVVYK
jgi:large subunit ribosomal protein L3